MQTHSGSLSNTNVHAAGHAHLKQINSPAVCFFMLYMCVCVCAFVQCVYVLLRGQTQLSEPHGQILQPPSPQTQPSTSLPWLVRAEDSALVPSLHWLPRSLPSGRISQSCPSSGSGSPGCSGQTLGWLVSADAASAAAAAAGAKKASGGCQRGRRRAGRQEGNWAHSAPTRWGRQNQGAE